MIGRARLWAIFFGWGCSCAALACDEQSEQAPPSARSTTAPGTAPPPPKPAGPPAFEIDTVSAKVGYERALLDTGDGRRTLRQLLEPTHEYLAGGDASLLVDRQAKVPWVVAFIDELGNLGVKHVLIKTETRPELSNTLPFFPPTSLKSPPDCSVVAMVLEDRGTAVWKLSGGVAIKHGKGMAGPDLSMTGDNIQRFAKGCKQSSVIFFSAGPSVEWGLLYDLAASSKVVEHASFDTFVVLREAPVPGRRVELRE